MSYCWTCPKCGTTLEPCEKCGYEREPVRSEADMLRAEIIRLMKSADVKELRAMYGFLNA